ncbi:hypothetical protein GOV13_01505 [Candidatus Pacearchaeota archaeon]|nr:hypothetical protein [Candidatus Pacearchaeota archaeon]
MTDEVKQPQDMKEDAQKTRKLAEAKISEKKEVVKKKKISEDKVKDVSKDKQITQIDKPKPTSDTQKQKTSDESLTTEKTPEPKGEAKSKPDDKPKEPKKKIVPKKMVEKEEVVVNGKSLHISTKYAMAICKFVKGKKIDKAIEDLEMVVVKKKAVPMKGEIPHRKGKGMMSGRFPKKASENFIMLLNSLKSNANNHGVEDPIIVEAVANMAQRPFASGGKRKKRTHVTIKAREKKLVKKTKKKKVGGKK